jgi:hypothetical protein
MVTKGKPKEKHMKKSVGFINLTPIPSTGGWQTVPTGANVLTINSTPGCWRSYSQIAWL